MAELRRHRDLSEAVFGLVLAERLDACDIPGETLVYPYNRAIEDLPDANAAELSLKYGHDAIEAAMHAAERTNGIAPHHWVEQLAATFRDYKVVNLMGRLTKKVDQGETIDWGTELGALGGLTEIVSTEPLAWSDLEGDFSHEWMWAGWIPRNEMTLLVGQQEAGKSAVALTLVDAVANGVPLPDGSYCPRPTKVAWIETEGRHTENIYRSRMWEVKGENIVSPAGTLRKVLDLTQPDDKAIVRALVMRPDIGMLVIDSLGGSLMNENESSAKKILQEMASLAQETNTTTLIIHHLRKPQGRERGVRPRLEHVRGHSGITQFAPSVLAIEYDPDMPYRTLFPLKNNLGPKPPDLMFSIGQYGPLFETNTTNQVKKIVRDEFIEWLVKMNKPVASKELLRLAAEAGFEKETVKFALKHSAVVVNRQDGITYIAART